eukprot:CAMPEP_0119309550 /NCGR_PEP_ID=MMETSP1333-20130426/15829_1 /TAXON_ID=418940 /ORGANISM="Scyphosphaera apsteinii, Strain RCC1455" /LENGTH=795 /DNA_ID=CAMNT_0007313543 /DNA_START=59 /DNA_END=2442 /DNA_ORIENTATION=-
MLCILLLLAAQQYERRQFPPRVNYAGLGFSSALLPPNCSEVLPLSLVGCIRLPKTVLQAASYKIPHWQPPNCSGSGAIGCVNVPFGKAPPLAGLRTASSQLSITNFSDSDQVSLSAGALTNFVACGDVDGDGANDLFISDNIQGARVLFNDGTGGFPPSRQIYLELSTFETADTAAFGDVDGDGDLDLFLSGLSYNGDTSGIQVLNYDHTGHFATSNWLTFKSEAEWNDSGSATQAAAFGDVDGDLDLDLLIANLGPDKLLLNSGFGVFTFSIDFTGDDDVSSSVAFADVDGSGSLDALIGTIGGPNKLLINNGAGQFTLAGAKAFSSNGMYTNAVAFGDVDADGDIDVALGGSFENELLFNDGTGNFTHSELETSKSQHTYAMAFGDFDGDADLDLLVGTDQTGGNELLVNDGNGVYSSIFPWYTRDGLPDDPDHFLRATHSIAVGDLDGDSSLDVLFGNDGRNELLLNKADTYQSFSRAAGHAHSFSKRINAVAVGDVDQDGDLDILVGGRADMLQGQHAVLMLNDGSGDFAASIDFSHNGTDVTAVAFGDVDGDKDLDFIVGTSLAVTEDEGEDGWIVGGSLDGFAVPSPSPSASEMGTRGSSNKLLLNNGYLNGYHASMTFTQAADFPEGFAQTSAVAFGDVDGDDDLDLLIGNADGPNEMLINDGRGGFTSSSGLLAGSGFTKAVAFGDVDGDNDLDVILGNNYDTTEHIELPNQLLLNDGSGYFTIAATFYNSDDMARTTAVAFGDLNGDDNIDIIFGNDYASSKIYLNDGKLYLDDAAPSPSPSPSPS